MSKKNWPAIPVTMTTGSILHWNRSFRGKRGARKVPVTCGHCHKERVIEAVHANGKSKTFTGLCNSCRLRSLNLLLGKTVDHPAWKGGRFKDGGYWIIQVSTLSSKEKQMAEKMGKKYANGTFIVSEHRLVMAMSIGRPLTKQDVVHHRNGIKTDNRIENLELTTHADHRRLDVKYYDLWQKALAEIEILKEQISELVGKQHNSPPD